MIICGYAGIGKSSLAKTVPGVMDLESTPFGKDWDTYAKCAEHYSKQGYIVLVSCHREIRERICRDVPYHERVTIVPDVSEMERYRERYEMRGNTKEFIDTQMSNWHKWLDMKSNMIPDERWLVMNPGEYLSDIMRRLFI